MQARVEQSARLDLQYVAVESVIEVHTDRDLVLVDVFAAPGLDTHLIAGGLARAGHLDTLRQVGVELIYGDDVWPLREPRTPPVASCPGLRSLRRLSERSNGANSD